MKKILLLLTSFTVFQGLYSQDHTDLKSEVDAIINPLVTTNNYSGTIVISKGDDILISEAYGKMSQEYELANTPDTKFFVASLSMIFTSAAVLKLVESGDISLTDNLSKFITGFHQGDSITIHDMLAQRSGIPAIGSQGNVDYDSITKFTHTTEKLISYFQNYELLYSPGTKYGHGRSEYILLASIIEKVSGKPFGEFLKDEIFNPLEMYHTGHYTGEKEIIKDLAKGYAPKGLYDIESAYQIDWSSKTGHASIYTTALDLQKFARAAMENRLLTEESWERIFTNYGEKVGYGWFITRHLNRVRYQMNGRSPGFSSYLGIYPAEKLTVVMLSNNYISLPAEIGRSLGALVLDEPFEPLNLTNQSINDVYAKKLVGTYKFDDTFYVPNYELKIEFENGNMVSEWGGFIPIDNGEEDPKAFILRTYWSDIRFVENESGEIYEMTFDGHKGVKEK